MQRLIVRILFICVNLFALLQFSSSQDPTGQPSGQPSGQPTGQPSIPTGQPSGAPSGQPSGQPSCQPSSRPTEQPSQPSGQPTTQPTGQPTVQPSVIPTGQPTTHPTGQPTGFPTFMGKSSHVQFNSYHYGYNHIDQHTLSYIGSNTITNLGHRDVFLSISVWPSGFGVTQYVSFYTYKNVPLLSNETSCRPSTYSSLCGTSYFGCVFNLNVTEHIRSEKGGSLLLMTNSSGIGASFVPPCPYGKKTDNNIASSLVVKFVLSNSDEYGACPLGRFYSMVTNCTQSTSCCQNCPAGKYSDFSGQKTLEDCMNCPAGQYPIFASDSSPATSGGATGCELCPPGTYMAEGSATYSMCPRGQYMPTAGGTSCLACPLGKTTANAMSLAKDACVSPNFNYVMAGICFFFACIFGAQYVLYGRFHRIAFQRYTRVLSLLIDDTHTIISYVSYFNSRSDSERLLQHTCRRVKTWLFGIFSIVFVLFGTAFGFLKEIGGLVFKAMVLLKSFRFEVELFVERVGFFLSNIAGALNVRWVRVAIYPILTVLKAMANFRLDLKKIQVTCLGAAAPFHLLGDMCILGIITVLIQGDFQAYKLITYDGMVKRTEEMITKSLYLKWLIRERGTSVRWTYWGTMTAFIRILLSLFWKVFSSIDIFQSALQFTMSSINLQIFIAHGGGHAYSPECNTLEGFEGVDEAVAFCTTILFWAFSVPVIYEVANVLVPGMPPGCAAFDAVEEKTEDFTSVYKFHWYLRLFSYVAPDLIWASIASGYIQDLTKDTPEAPGFYVRSVRQVEVDEIARSEAVKSKLITNAGGQSAADEDRASEGISPDFSGDNAFDKARASSGNMAVLGDDSVKESGPLLKVIEQPILPTFKVEASALDGYVMMSLCAKSIRSTRVFESVYLDKNLSGVKYVLFKISRATGLLEFTETYDIYNSGLHCDSRGARHLAQDLNDTNDNYIVVVATTGDPKNNHLHNGLPQSIYRCGGSPHVFGAGPLRRGYILIGVPGCGEGNGFEVKPKATPPELEVDFSVTNGSDGVGWRINEKISSGRMFLKSGFAKRTNKENHDWKIYSVENMPTYWNLCKKEHADLVETLSNYTGRSSWFISCIAFIITFFGLGHVCSSTGRRALYVVYWKYLRFIQVALGIWTDEMVKIYRVHSTVRALSTTWDEPIVKIDLHDAKCKEISAETDHNILEKTKSHIKLKFRFLLEDEYALALYALIAPRATFLQLIPYCSALSIFVSFTAHSPVIVPSESLRANLVAGLAEDSFQSARILKEQEFDRLWCIKHYEANEESYTIPLDGTESPAEKEKIETKNTISRARQQLVMQEGKLVVRNWEVFLKGVVLYFTNSRYVNYARGFCKWLIAVLLLYTDEKWNETLVVVSLIVTLPIAFVEGIEFCMFVGRAMWITDEELYREFGCILRLFQCLGAMCSCFSRKVLPASARAETGLSEVGSEGQEKSATVEMTSSLAIDIHVENPVHSPDSSTGLSGSAESVDRNQRDNAIASQAITQDKSRSFNTAVDLSSLVSVEMVLDCPQEVDIPVGNPLLLMQGAREQLPISPVGIVELNASAESAGSVPSISVGIGREREMTASRIAFPDADQRLPTPVVSRSKNGIDTIAKKPVDSHHRL